MQGQGRPLQAAGGGHHPTTIGQSGRQVSELGSTLQHGLGMHGHLAGLRPQRITAGRHQAQFGHPEIGAQACHAAQIAGAGRLHQHQMQGHGCG